MTKKHIDYFAPAPSEEEAALRIIKGTYRRKMVMDEMKDGLENIPSGWLAHELTEILKNFLGGKNPRMRGGEDLPDFAVGEVEIARITLTNSVHNEVTSLRARPCPTGSGILLKVVDEYENKFKAPRAKISAPLSAREVVEFLNACKPNPFETECEFALQSFFYPDLQQIADELGVASEPMDD